MEGREEGDAHEAGHEAERDERERAPVGVYGGHEVVPRVDGARAREEAIEVQRGGIRLLGGGEREDVHLWCTRW